jgi:hypothetical protein
VCAPPLRRDASPVGARAVIGCHVMPDFMEWCHADRAAVGWRLPARRPTSSARSVTNLIEDAG